MNEVDERVPSRARLVLLILEGYAYLALIVAFPAAATAFVAWGVVGRRPFVAIAAILVGVPLALTTWRTVRTLFFRFPEPKGIRIDLPLGSRLIEEVEVIRRRLGAPRVHRIIVSDGYNASALQRHRAGIWSARNTLVLGYPLLAVVPEGTVRAVIAHELAHMALAHGRSAGWVYRTSDSWWRLMNRLEREGGVPAYAYLLFRFYLPRLQTHAVVVSRRHEFVADRLAAEVTGPELTAQALVATAIGGYLLERTFWPRIFDRVQHDPDPPGPLAEMHPGIWSAVHDRAQLLGEVLTRETNASDTHPALRDRLARLGPLPPWPQSAAPSAADYFFGSRKNELAAKLDAVWRAEPARTWRATHERIRNRRERLVALASLPAPGAAQIYERAVLIEEEGDAQTALELYRSLHRDGHAAAGLAAGRILLEREEDESGIALIEWAMEKEPPLTAEGCDTIAEFLDSRGRSVDAHRFRVRGARHQVSDNLAAVERDTLSVVDRFGPPPDGRFDIAAVTRRLAVEPAVLQAFLVTKQLRYSTGTQTLVALMVKNSNGSNLCERLRSEGVLPPDVTVASFDHQDQQLYRALECVPRGRIYGVPSGGRRSGGDR